MDFSIFSVFQVKGRFEGKKGMSGQSMISIISTDLGPFGANSVITFGLSISIRWYTSIFLKFHRFPES